MVKKLPLGQPYCPVGPLFFHYQRKIVQMKRPNIVGLTEHHNKTAILQAPSQDKKFIKKHFLENKTLKK